MKTKIFNLIIIDESGSMGCIKKQAIDSVNETIQTIRKAQSDYEEQEHFVTLVTFNNTVKCVNYCSHIDVVEEFTDEIYKPSYCTALYDAMGMSLTELRSKVDEDDKVVVTIVTDGYENASQEYNGSAIKALVDELKQKGWVFAYIGANHDVVEVANGMSIKNVMRFETTNEGAVFMSKKMAGARERFFMRVNKKDLEVGDANEDFFDEV